MLATQKIIAWSPELGDGTMVGFFPSALQIKHSLTADFKSVEYLIMGVMPKIQV